jgi:hypothetical protein
MLVQQLEESPTIASVIAELEAELSLRVPKLARELQAEREAGLL